MRTALLIHAAVLGLATALAAPAVAQENRFDALADLPFVEGRPTGATAASLRRELTFEGATQAYLWALPLINTLGMKFGSEAAFGAGYNIPKAPEGKTANWLPTAPGHGFFAILRLYGPGESAIDYSWKPGDFEKKR